MFARAAAFVAVVMLLLVSMPTTTTTAAADFTPISAPAALAALRGATAQVMAFGCNLRSEDGTAVAVDGTGLVTNAHVIAASRTVEVVGDDRPTEVGGGPMVATAADVATIAVGGPPFAPLVLAPRDPGPGSAVRVAGYPGAPIGQIQAGLTVVATSVVDYIPGAMVDQPGQVMRLAASVQPGMSGGPVLDASGRLAGIVFGDDEASGDALAIPASQLRRLLAPDSLVPSSC